MSQALVDQAIEALLPEAVRANGKLVKQIENAVRQAETWEDMQILLAELLGHDAEQDELEELLARIMLNAAAFGAHAVGTGRLMPVSIEPLAPAEAVKYWKGKAPVSAKEFQVHGRGGPAVGLLPCPGLAKADQIGAVQAATRKSH